MVLFQALNWESRDVDGEYLISIFGRAEDGRSVCVTTAFKPYFFVKLPRNATESSVKLLWQKIGDGPESYNLLKSKDLWGFQNNEKSSFMKLNFVSMEKMRKCDNKLRKPLRDETYPHKIYESNLDPVLRFMHRTGIQSTGWMDTSDSCVRANISRCTMDLFCTNWMTLKPVDYNAVAPFIVASFDIETYSSTGKFPDADIRADAVFQVAFTLKKQGEHKIYDTTCLCLKDTGPVDGANIISFETEKELLMATRDYIVRNDIDILTGWNIFGFDLEYLCKRAIQNGCLSDFCYLGKLKDVQSDMIYKKLSSSALGDNTLKLLPMPGRFTFDLFHEVKREKKLDSYRLDYVAEMYLGDNKIDMTPKEMFARYRRGIPYELAEVAEYCIKDTVLPHRLVDKLCVLLNLLEMAKATWVPINYLAERGQQIKVFSQVTRVARQKGFMVPTVRWGTVAPEQYEGATVLDAQKGAYYVPITALDFEGLYPSIMMAHNLCYSTLVLDSKYDNIPGVKYESFEIDGKVHKFAQDVPSLIPSVLEELKAFRKQAKNEMAKATGQMKDVFNGKQLAYKVSMNSVYGFTGASRGMLPCIPIAATVTCEGRHMIEQTKELVEREFPGSKVRYGDTDSVMVEFDCDGHTGQEALDYSWQLGEQAAELCNQLFKKPKNLELEKVYWPYILYSKKRYAAKMWTRDRNGEMKMDCIDVKGLQLVRRDNIPFVREVSREILDIILDSNDTAPAKELAHKRALELLEGKVSMKKLTLSQKLAESYKNENLAHVRVRDKMREREPGSEPQPGDRVPYVLVKAAKKTATQGDRAEDPKWAEKHKLPLDYDYYFTNKFMNPICDLLEPLVENPKTALFGDLLPKKKMTAPTGKQNTIDNMFKRITSIISK
jgi:DNA polymerase delta subunit 1